MAFVMTIELYALIIILVDRALLARLLFARTMHRILTPVSTQLIEGRSVQFSHISSQLVVEHVYNLYVLLHSLVDSTCTDYA